MKRKLSDILDDELTENDLLKIGKNSNLYKNILDSLEEAQKEAIKETLQLVADRIDLKEATSDEHRDYPCISNDMGDVYYIDIPEILKLKRELFRQINI